MEFGIDYVVTRDRIILIIETIAKVRNKSSSLLYLVWLANSNGYLHLLRRGCCCG